MTFYVVPFEKEHPVAAKRLMRLYKKPPQFIIYDPQLKNYRLSYFPKYNYMDLRGL